MCQTHIYDSQKCKVFPLCIQPAVLVLNVSLGRAASRKKREDRWKDGSDDDDDSPSSRGIYSGIYMVEGVYIWLNTA